MTLYSKLDRYLLFPLAEKFFGSAILKNYYQLKKTDWLDAEQLFDLQNKKLVSLIEHCYKNVPYYTKLFNNLGLTPSDIRTREDLTKLPILTKEIIRKNMHDLLSLDVSSRKTTQHSTGGSTGVPLKFSKDICSWNSAWGSTFRFWEWAGFNFGEKMFTLGGNSLVKKPFQGRKLTKKDIFDTVIMRNKKCSCTDITEHGLKEHYQIMMSTRPKAIRGYASSIYFLARYIEKYQLPIHPVKVVFTTGEKLVPKYRAKIQEIFHVPVFDGYGAGDGGIQAFECYMHEGLHINEENCVVEIIDTKKQLVENGIIGNVITTDLNNYSFPFLRYKVGDLAYIKQELCSCGRNSRLIGEVIGREGKAIYNKEGRPFSSIILDNMMFKDLDYHKKENQYIYEKIDKFQIRQDKNGNIQILIKPILKNELMETFSYVKDNFEKYFPNSLVELTFVDDIPPLPSGKEDYCVSDYEYK